MSGRQEDISQVRKYYALKSDLRKAHHCANPDKERVAALESEMQKLEEELKPFVKLNTKQ